MRKKLIFAIHRLSKNGGAPRYVFELAKRAVKKFDVIILTFEVDKNLDLRGIKIIQLEKPSLPYIFGQIQGTFRITQECKRLKQKYGKNCLIHSQGNVSLNSDIITSHGCYKSWIKYLIRNNKNIFKKIIYLIDPNTILPAFIEKMAYVHSREIISISKLTKDQILKEHGLNSKIVYHGVNIEDFSFKKEKNLRKKLSIDDGELMLLFVGHYPERKGLKELIIAMKLINLPIKLVVVGKGDIKKYVHLSNLLGLKEKIIFYGKSDNIQEFYKNSDMFIFPTKFEPFGLVTLEACACGLPSITTNKKENGFAELLTSGKDSLLLNTPVNPKNIADNIILLAKNKKLYHKIRKNARILAEKNAWGKVYQETEKLYNEILSN